MLRPLQQAIVDMQRVPGAELHVQLQHDGLRVLGVQQPGTPELRRGASVGPEKIWGSKGAVEVPEAFATGGVGTTLLICAIGAVPGSIAAQGNRQAAGGLGLRARQGAKGAEARLCFGGGYGAAALIGGITAFILTVALPGARKTLSISTEELI